MSFTVPDYLIVAGATAVAGAVNALAGGGTLISFPTLVALGVPSLPANVTNTVALCPGYFSGALAQREDLGGQRRRLVWLAGVAGAGGLAGSAVLEVTPEATFQAVVPYLLVLSCVLLAGQERVRAWVRARTAAGAQPAGPDSPAAGAQPAPPAAPGAAAGAPTPAPPAAPGAAAGAQTGTGAAPAGADRHQGRDAGPAGESVGRPPALLQATVFVGAVYGGFFGAGLGIMLLALLGLFLDDTMVRTNAVKQVLQLVINVLAAAFFAVSGHVRWELVPVMGLAGIVGGTVGGRLVRAVRPTWLRRFVVLFGLAVAVDFWITK